MASKHLVIAPRSSYASILRPRRLSFLLPPRRHHMLFASASFSPVLRPFHPVVERSTHGSDELIRSSRAHTHIHIQTFFLSRNGLSLCRNDVSFERLSLSRSLSLSLSLSRLSRLSLSRNDLIYRSFFSITRSKMNFLSASFFLSFFRNDLSLSLSLSTARLDILTSAQSSSISRNQTLHSFTIQALLMFLTINSVLTSQYLCLKAIAATAAAEIAHCSLSSSSNRLILLDWRAIRSLLLWTVSNYVRSNSDSTAALTINWTEQRLLLICWLTNTPAGDHTLYSIHDTHQQPRRQSFVLCHVHYLTNNDSKAEWSSVQRLHSIWH